MEYFQEAFSVISQVTLVVMILATILVQLTPTKLDDRKLDSIVKKIHKYMSFFPTIGRNPVTKEIMQSEEGKRFRGE